MSRVVTIAPPPMDEREILRYAGCRTTVAEVDRLLAECLAQALPTLTYTACYEEIDPAPFIARSAQLARHLCGCRRVFVMAATVGHGLDRLIARYGVVSPAKAVMFQAIGTERVEALCDAVCTQLANTCGGYATPRFSPGYGDLPLDVQREVCESLQAGRRIGVTLNDALLMAPTKSVTAFVGIADQPQSQRVGCRACEKKDCVFRGAV